MKELSTPMRIAYVSDCYKESAIFQTQVHDYLQHLEAMGRTEVHRFFLTKTWRFRHDRDVLYMPPKMFPASAWLPFAWLNKLRAPLKRADVGIFRGYFGGQVLLALKEKPKLSVLDIRGDVLDEMSRQLSLNGKLNRLFIPIVEKNLARQIASADLIFTVSENQRRQVIESYGKNSEKVRAFSTTVSSAFRYMPGVGETLRKEFGISRDEVVFTYSGGLSQWQKVPMMLGAFKKHTETSSVGTFLLLTREVDHARVLVREAGIPEGRVLVIGSPPEDVPRYLQIADVGLLIRDNIATNRNASPTKLGEYLNCGLHAIINDIEADYVRAVKLQGLRQVLVLKEPSDLERAFSAFQSRPAKIPIPFNRLDDVVSAQVSLFEEGIAAQDR